MLEIGRCVVVGIALFVYAAPVIVLVVLIWVVARRAPQTSRTAQHSVALTHAVRAAQTRAIVAIGFTAVLLFVGFAVATAFPSLLGVPVAVAPALAGTGGLLLYAFTPPAADPSGVTHAHAASLTPRRGWTFTPRKTLVGLFGLVAATFALFVVTGVTSSTDDAGRHRAMTFVGDGFMSSASPYPGWFYAIPLMVATAGLVVAALLALRRLASTPSLPGPGLEQEDTVWRVESTRVLTTLLGAMMALQFGGVGVIAGNTARNAASHPDVSGVVSAAADAILVVGFVALVASLVCFTLAVLRAFGLQRTLQLEVDA